MGTIKQDIVDVFLPKHPEQEQIIKPFLNGFDITYAEKKELNNTVLFSYMIKPEPFMKDAFGLEKEILLVYSPFDTLEARALQAANMLFKTFPYMNRIDTLNFFMVSKDDNILNYAGIMSFSEEESRSIVPFLYEELRANVSDSWYIRKVLKRNFYDVDLFGYMLPLRDESSFFGRQQIAARYIDAIKRCENRGIFGLRKTGKTSFLFKIDRIIREQHLGFVFFYDCKSPSYRKLHWNELLGEICNNIAKRLRIPIRKEYDEKNIIKSFRYVVKTASDRNQKIIIMFDEIEYISFKSPLDAHWKTEFIDFWQTIWSVQSLHRNLVFILSGVNPSAIETDTINGVQNPLFSIVQSEYLHGLTEDESKNMIRTLGRRMGLKFDVDAVKLLYDQFNGHPMLIRLACSYINRQYGNDANRPVTIKGSDIKSMQNDIDVELAYYFKHVVSEIQKFYPEEYEMFELLASGQTADFIELSAITEYTKHLYSYGLIGRESGRPPFVKMPVAGRYVAMELAKKEKRKTLYRIVEPAKRNQWVSQRVKSIIRDLRQLESAIRSKGSCKLFGENSFPEAERFAALHSVQTESEFENFFNVCNRCFVESIENYGKSIGKKKYFWTDIKNSYPTLFEVLHRIKVYRHSRDHLTLDPQVAQLYTEYWNTDTKDVTDSDEQRFVIQQRILESFLSAIQVEIDVLT